jgi:hypothetical protein
MFETKLKRLTMRLLGLLKSSSNRYCKLHIKVIKSTDTGAIFQIEPKFDQNTISSLLRSYIKSSDKELFDNLTSLKFDPNSMQLEVRFSKPESIST